MPTFAFLPHHYLLFAGVLGNNLTQDSHSTELDLKLSFLYYLLFEKSDFTRFANVLVGGIATSPTGVGWMVVLFVFENGVSKRRFCCL